MTKRKGKSEERELKKLLKRVRKLTDEYFSILILSEALGITVSEEGELIKDIISEHPEYADFLDNEESEEIVTEDEETMNPTAHIIIEAIIQSQKAKEEPPEVREAYITLLKEGVNPHEARHAIGRVFTEMLWLMSNNKLSMEPNDYYRKQLKELIQQKLKHHVFRDY